MVCDLYFYYSIVDGGMTVIVFSDSFRTLFSSRKLKTEKNRQIHWRKLRKSALRETRRAYD